MTKHWTATEIERIMHERGLTIAGLSAASGIGRRQIYSFFAGDCLLTLPNIEKLARALHYEMEMISDGTPSPALDCQYCGAHIIPVEVHGHTQCPRCQAILERCCED